jgi:hypothetical protein
MPCQRGEGFVWYISFGVKSFGGSARLKQCLFDLRLPRDADVCVRGTSTANSVSNSKDSEVLRSVETG